MQLNGHILDYWFPLLTLFMKTSSLVRYGGMWASAQSLHIRPLMGKFTVCHADRGAHADTEGVISALQWLSVFIP